MIIVVQRHQVPYLSTYTKTNGKLELNPYLLSLFPEHRKKPLSKSTIAEGTEHFVRSAQQEVHLSLK